MKDIGESLDQLTASLQELAASRQSRRTDVAPALPKSMPADRLVLTPEVKAFVQQNHDYAARTCDVSVGTY